MADNPDETYSEEETVARRERALKRMLTTPHKPQKDSKLGKRRPYTVLEPTPSVGLTTPACPTK
jgi:hypothetical protein